MKAITVYRTLALVLLTTVVSCASPTEDVEGLGGPLGYLSLGMPSEIPRSSDDLLNPLGQRAVGTVSQVEVEVFDASQNSIAKKVFQKSDTTTVIGIPPGTDYRVTLKVYNLANSGSTPTVTGSASGVTITSGQTTSVSITCVPYQPIDLVETAIVSFAKQQSDAFYRFTVQQGVPYLVRKYDPENDNNTSGNFGVIWAIFDASGKQRAGWTHEGELLWTPDYTGVAYVGLYQDDIGAVTVPLSVKAFPSNAVGSTNKPEILHPGHWDYIGVGDTAPSYFRFTTSYSRTYQLDLGAQTSFVAMLYPSNDFTGAATAFTSSGGVVSLPVNAGTYSLTLQTTNSGGYFGRGSLLPVLPTVGEVYIAGTVDKPHEKEWFVVNVEAGASYAVLWDDYYEGTGTYTLDAEVTAYKENLVDKYFSQDSGYHVAYNASVPVGQTKMYVMVASVYSTNVGTFAVKVRKLP